MRGFPSEIEGLATSNYRTIWYVVPHIPCPRIRGDLWRWKLSMLLLLPVRQAGSGTKSGLREKNQGLKFLAFPVVLPATSITIASVEKRMAQICECYRDICYAFVPSALQLLQATGQKSLTQQLQKSSAKLD